MSKKITVFGTRGIPDVLGGVETHCQNLYPAIKQQLNVDICVIARSSYVNYKRSVYKKVETYTLWAPKKRLLEAIVYSILAVFRTRIDYSDIVYVHAIGLGLTILLLHVMGKKVVFTHRGPDYDRQKWGFATKKILLLGERWAVGYANKVIVISGVINQLIQKKHGRYDAHLTHNGVNEPWLLSQLTIGSTFSRFGLQPKNCLVVIGRFVEEKGMHDAIVAHQHSGLTMPLVLIGDADHPTEYSVHLEKLAADTPGVVMTGFPCGDELQAVFSQTKLFVMPSYHEGLPIALLEAMSFSLLAVVSDIPANLEIQLPAEVYFKVGDVTGPAEKLGQGATANGADYGVYLQSYNWHEIAKKTANVYHSINKDIG